MEPFGRSAARELLKTLLRTLTKSLIVSSRKFMGGYSRPNLGKSLHSDLGYLIGSFSWDSSFILDLDWAKKPMYFEDFSCFSCFFLIHYLFQKKNISSLGRAGLGGACCMKPWVPDMLLL